MELAELLHRHVLLRAGERGGKRLVEGILKIAAAFSGVECAITTSSKVRFMSSIIASRLPPALELISLTGRGVLSSSPRPSDWASRRAGSMVSTTTLRPASAARTAEAAEVVVLPTPPEPQQMTILVWRSSMIESMSRKGEATSARPPAELVAELVGHAKTRRSSMPPGSKSIWISGSDRAVSRSWRCRSCSVRAASMANSAAKAAFSSAVSPGTFTIADPAARGAVELFMIQRRRR